MIKSYSILVFYFFLITHISSKITGDIPISGSTADGWEYVRDFVRENIIDEKDLGVSLAVYHHGNLVVDLTAGWFDKARTTLYDNNTLQLVFSTTKGLVGVAAALCVQRGLLNYSDLVTKYWPEYGIHGKENTTFADILSHRAGLPFDNSSFDQYYNWTGMVKKLENEKPLWVPGTAHGYHPLTYGWLAGEIIKRVDSLNRTFGQFVQDEIAKALDIEFYVGLPSEQEYRVSPLDFSRDPNGTTLNTFDVFNDKQTHQAEIPGANGITNARSLAKLYASLLGNTDNNQYKRLLNEEILNEAIKSNTPAHEIDLTLNSSTQFSKGFILMDGGFPLLGSQVFGYSGYGGSVAFAAPQRGLAFAYVINRIDPELPTDTDIRYKSLIQKIATTITNNNAGQNFRSSVSSYLLFFFTILLLFIFNSFQY